MLKAKQRKGTGSLGTWNCMAFHTAHTAQGQGAEIPRVGFGFKGGPKANLTSHFSVLMTRTELSPPFNLRNSLLVFPKIRGPPGGEFRPLALFYHGPSHPAPPLRGLKGNKPIFRLSQRTIKARPSKLTPCQKPKTPNRQQGKAPVSHEAHEHRGPFLGDKALPAPWLTCL